MGYYVPKFNATGEWRTEWWSFRHLDRIREISFCHSAALVSPEGKVVLKATVGYCNRTWESRRGLTARRKLASLLRSDKHRWLMEEAGVSGLVDGLEDGSRDVEAYSSASGTQVGFSLSMCCPM